MTARVTGHIGSISGDLLPQWQNDLKTILMSLAGRLIMNLVTAMRIFACVTVAEKHFRNGCKRSITPLSV